MRGLVNASAFLGSNSACGANLHVGQESAVAVATANDTMTTYSG